MVPISFLSLAMLAGLAVLVIPPLIHLLNRRRYEVIEWGAMQFLEMSEVTRRRMHLEELLLMLLRIGLLAVLVLALAGPYLDSSSRLLQGGRVNRDVVLVFDGSASMSYTGTGKSAQDQAKEWAIDFVQKMAPGDGVAILHARQQAIPVLGQLTTDRERVIDQIRRMPGPSGSASWPAALEQARAILQESQRSEREIILISDNQRVGWADDRATLAWKDFVALKKEQAGTTPRAWVVNLDPQRPANPPNWSLAALSASRAVVAVEQEVTFRTAMQLHGQTHYERPHRLRLEVNGQFIKNIETPLKASLERGQIPLTFKYRFPKQPGSYLVSLILEPDLPPAERGPGYVIKDHLPADNRQDFAVEVVRALPVLLVDGDTTTDPKTRGSFFLRDALSPARDQTPVVQARVIPIQEFNATSLVGSGSEREPSGIDDRPRVLILSNVARLSGEQQRVIDRFLQQGGGVLVTLGERCERDHYNAELHREGKGWLPAKLDEKQGDEKKVKESVRPLPSSFYHPALEMFRRQGVGGLETAWFARWWKLSTPGAGSTSTPVALFHKETLPFLVERAHGEGKVLLCSVPLDNSWRTNVVDVPAYVPLVHEMVYYLASLRVGEHNLPAGQPLRYRLPTSASLAGLTLQSPSGETRPFSIEATDDRSAYAAQIVQQVQGPILVSEGLREAGIWKLSTPEQQTQFYVVQSDSREADLTPMSEAERKQLEKLAPLTFVDHPEELRERLSNSSSQVQLWWWFLLGLIVLLCSEVFMTRWIVKQR